MFRASHRSISRRQIEAKALRKLKHPSRSRLLRVHLEH
jgi:DNA-directed RNA polymerase sigma subunit (sigma70/sigma32)